MKGYATKKCRKCGSVSFVHARQEVCTKCKTKKCFICKKSIIIPTYRNNFRNYCSRECQHKGIDKGALMKCICKMCKKEYCVYRSQKEWRGSNYCSKECQYKGNSTFNSGRNSKRWKGGHHQHTYNKLYAEWVYKNKGLLLEELGCEVCGIRQGVIFDRHHIVYKSEKPKHQEMNNPLNIIQVCRQCHLDFHSKKLSRYNLVIERGLVELFGKGIIPSTGGVHQR